MVTCDRRKYDRFDVIVDMTQPLITDFALERSRDQLIIQNLLKSNKEFRKALKTKATAETLGHSHFLRTLLDQSLKRSATGKRLLRYDDHMKQIGLYLYMVAGPIAYETLALNLPLPKKTTVLEHLGREAPFREGAFQFEEVADFIGKQGWAREVWIAEDDTKLLERLKYNESDDTIIGLELPLDENGVPKTSFFKFSKISAVKKYLEEYPKTSYAKLLSCRSLDPNSSPLILVVYGTQGTDQSAGVGLRWRYVFESLKKVGLTVMGKILADIIYGSSK